MRNTLKTKVVDIDGLGQIEIRELSWRRMQEILAAEKAEDDTSTILACKYGVPSWADESVDDIADNNSPVTIAQLSAEIVGMMGEGLGKGPAKNGASPSD